MSDPRTPLPPPPPGPVPGLFQPPVLEIFANQVRLGATVSDFAIVFGLTRMTFPGHSGPMTPRDQVIVRLSPTTMKQLSLNLQMAVEAYEEAVGAIIMPEAADRLAASKRDLVANLRGQMGAAATRHQPSPSQSGPD